MVGNGAFSQSSRKNVTYSINHGALSTTQILSGYESSVEFYASSSWTGETSSVGNDESHNNIQPYIVTYMWKRV